MSGFVVAVWRDQEGTVSFERRWSVSVSSLGRRTAFPVRTRDFGPVRTAFADDPRSLAWERGDCAILTDGLPFAGSAESNRALVREEADEWISDPFQFTGRATGHFAAALVNGRQGELTLVRDRFGIRPLWFLKTDEVIAAASECMMLRPFAAAVGFDEGALRESVMCRWIVGRHHLMEPFRQVLPGTAVTLSFSRGEVERRYWSMQFDPAPPARAVSAYVDEAESAIRQGFHDLDVAGKPVAILLSGGIDSSVLAALAKDECGEVVGIVGRLPGDPNVETERALFVSRSLGLETLVVDVDPGAFAEDFPQMVARLGQPPMNPNNLVLQQLLRKVPEGIRLVLNGDAAEMMFGLADVKRVGQFASKAAVSQKLFPPPLASSLAHFLRRSDSSFFWRAARLLDHSPLEFAAELDSIEYGPALRRALRDWAGSPMEFISVAELLEDEERPLADRLQAYQTFTFLQSSLLRHDRLTIPLGLEPVFLFLSPPVVDFCLRLPRDYRFLDQSKPLLRILCERHLPEKVSRWPKLGFPVPWKGWLDDHLKPFRSSLAGQNLEGKPFPFPLLEVAESEGDHEGIWTLLTLDMTWKMFAET